MEEDKKEIKLNQESIDILIANVIPTTKYFESRFDFLQHQINEIKVDMDKRFEQVDKRFEQIDKRFEQIDKRFEQIDKRFEQMDQKIENLSNEIHLLALEIKELSKKQETTIRDYIIERDRFYDKKFNNLRMFNIAIASVVIGVVFKVFGLFNIIEKIMTK